MLSRIVPRVYSRSRLVSCNRFQSHTRRCYSAVQDATSSSSANLPLAGYRVLDMTRVLAGTFRCRRQRQGCCGLTTSCDASAEVIKIEHPTRGDDTRAWGPPYATYREGSSQEGPGESAYFLGVNRNKKSLALSFQHPEGVDILHQLAAKCDILVENYLPGSLKKYGMDFATIHKINPSLIYASITGYGQTGPYSQRAGYDVMVEAEFGLMHITGSRDGPPVKVGVAVTDLTTGLYTSNSIMAALLARAKTGRGQHIDVALSDCQTATLANIASSCLISGKKDTGRWGTAHPSIVPYKSFKTKDGDVLFGGGNDKLFGILCDGLGRPGWKSDPKYSVNSQRVANRDELETEIEKISVQKTTQEWLEVFEGSGMPYAAVNDVQDTLNHEHTKARHMVIELEHDQCGQIKMVNTPVKYSESSPGARTAPPTLGQHTDEVLESVLGLSGSYVAQLREKGTIRLPHPPRASNCVPADFLYGGGSQGPPSASPALASSPTPSFSSSASRPPYVPQFSAATQMILNRIKSQPGSLSAALATASSLAKPLEKPSTDESKNHPAMNPNPSLTMTMPAPAPAPAPKSTTFSKTANTLRTPVPRKSGPVGPRKSGPVGAVKAAPPKAKGKAARGAKRKRGGKTGDGDSSSLSDLSDSDVEPPSKIPSAAAAAGHAPSPVLTMTKSGRQVQKPTQYNPALAAAAGGSQQKRKYYGKRTPEQALCKVCTRGRSVPRNDIVFCDGCNLCWHQRCHDPPIDDGYVSDESRSWFCGACAAKRERDFFSSSSSSSVAAAAAKDRSLFKNNGGGGFSWAGKPASEKWEYLSKLSHAQLVSIVMFSTNLYPDLPVFPSPKPSTSGYGPSSNSSHHHPSSKMPLSSSSSTSAAWEGSSSAKRKGNTAATTTTTTTIEVVQQQQQQQADRESSADSVPPAWPKVGRGALAGLVLDEADLRDDNDYEAFSVTTYDKKGNKIWENGMPV
ncbi:CoA-transferase family III domain-containing protein [Xylariomycetidae sp. FL0641]|nr:CoA-transferase family III domain-containing protein [Xylariomycetidae sp. FL0641]